MVTLSGPCATLPFVADPTTPDSGADSTPLPGATISFTVNGAASAVISSGQCVTVAWNTANVQAVYYQNAGVAGTDSRQECPAVTTTYTLRVVLPGNVETTRTVTVNVGTLAPPAIATLDMSLPPDYGSTSLTAGFMPDPFTVNLTGGGNVPVAYLGGCAGYTSSAPDYSVYYTSGAFPTLRFYFMGGGSDTTMVINTATASYICADDSYGTFNPTIDINNPVSGRYDIWIGGYNANTSVSARCTSREHEQSPLMPRTSRLMERRGRGLVTWPRCIKAISDQLQSQPKAKTVLRREAGIPGLVTRIIFDKIHSFMTYWHKGLYPCPSVIPPDRRPDRGRMATARLDVEGRRAEEDLQGESYTPGRRLRRGRPDLARASTPSGPECIG